MIVGLGYVSFQIASVGFGPRFAFGFARIRRREPGRKRVLRAVGAAVGPRVGAGVRELAAFEACP